MSIFKSFLRFESKDGNVNYLNMKFFEVISISETDKEDITNIYLYNKFRDKTHNLFIKKTFTETLKRIDNIIL